MVHVQYVGWHESPCMVLRTTGLNYDKVPLGLQKNQVTCPHTDIFWAAPTLLKVTYGTGNKTKQKESSEPSLIFEQTSSAFPWRESIRCSVVVLFCGSHQKAASVSRKTTHASLAFITNEWIIHHLSWNTDNERNISLRYLKKKKIYVFYLFYSIKKVIRFISVHLCLFSLSGINIFWKLTAELALNVLCAFTLPPEITTMRPHFSYYN